MKSFDKFQFDSSPQIDEEMEDLDESLVGAVRSAGQMVGNSLKSTGKALQRAQKKVTTLTSRASDKVQSVQKNLNKKIENVAGRTRPAAPPDPKSNTLLNKSGSFTGVKPTRPLSRKQRDDKADAISGLRAKGKLPSRFEGDTTKASKFRNLTRGGLRSSLARTAGSALLNVGKGLAQKPTRMVSYNQAGTGSLGAFQDLGQNVQGAAKNLASTKRFQPTTSQKVGYNPSGNTPTKTTPGKEDGRTVGSTLLNKGMNAITNQKDSVSSKKKPEVSAPEPKGSSRVTKSNRTDIPQSKTLFRKREQGNQERTSAGRQRTRFANQLQKIANQPTPRTDRNIIKRGTKTKPDAETQSELDKFNPSDILNRPKSNQSFINQYLQDINNRNKNSSIVSTKKNPVSRTDKDDNDDFTDRDINLGKAALNFAKMAPKADSDFRNQSAERAKKRKQGIDALRQAVASQPSSTQKSLPPAKKLKRPNIRSYKGDPDGYERARAAYNAQSPENKTKKGGGRPKKQTNQEGNENEMQKYKKDLKKRGVQEQFSDWREEFLWEVDKKYPEKAKEIKPMTGKNSITINPEDKSAKYKRGY